MKPYSLFFKAFSNETRLDILELLRKKGAMNVSRICKELGYKQPRVSRNLKCLVDCGFVENRRNGKEVVYTLNSNTIVPLLDIIDRHIGRYSKHLVACGIVGKR